MQQQLSRVLLAILAVIGFITTLQHVGFPVLKASVERYDDFRNWYEARPRYSGERMAKTVLSSGVPVRTCVVTVTDSQGVRHSVSVTAESLYEAAAQGLSVLRASGWVEGIGPASRLEVQVSEPATVHTVTLAQLKRWAQATAITPTERIRKDRVLKVLAGS